MTDKVPADLIEEVVGRSRHLTSHYGRAVSSEQTFYILHSHWCVEDNDDLRDCEFSKALDNGLDFDQEDELLILFVSDENTLIGVVDEL